MIQQESLPLLQPHPFPHPLFPHRHIRQMIQRIQLQELSPKRLFPLPQPQLLLHPHLSSPHPQFVAAITHSKSSRFCLHFILCSESFMRYLQLSAKRNNFYFHIIFLRIYMKILLKRELK